VFWRPREAALPAYDDLGAALPKMKTLVRRLYKAGVRIHTGSDTPNPFVVPGVSLHEELRLLVEAGLTPEEVWVAATRWAGETLGMAKLGTVQEGALADFLLFREDPTRDLAALSTLEAVVAQGRLYPKAVLEAALARHREYFNGWLYDRLSMVFARWLASRTTIDER
jgi:imidazolonepropionase-like amidohydrolase